MHLLESASFLSVQKGLCVYTFRGWQTLVFGLYKRNKTHTGFFYFEFCLVSFPASFSFLCHKFFEGPSLLISAARIRILSFILSLGCTRRIILVSADNISSFYIFSTVIEQSQRRVVCRHCSAPDIKRSDVKERIRDKEMQLKNFVTRRRLRQWSDNYMPWKERREW
jgi:hypothetical protein